MSTQAEQLGRACRPTEERFWSKVAKSAGCWVWTAPLPRDGYGRFWTPEKKHLAHRWAYENAVGPIPDGLELDHLCRNRACVNPDHLEVVTGAENTHRGFGPSALNMRKTHCVHGHEFTEENTVRFGDGARRCRACAREVRRQRKGRKFVCEHCGQERDWTSKSHHMKAMHAEVQGR